MAMMRAGLRWRALSLAMVALLGNAACQAFFGVDSEDAASTTGDGGGASTLAASGGTGGTPLPTECACLTPPSGPGWEGPLHVGEYPPNQGPSSCPGGAVPQKRYVGPTPGSCGACSCGPVAGAVCPTQVLCYPSTNCTGSVSDQSALFAESTDDLCAIGLDTPDPWSCRVMQAPASGGSCAPSAGEAIPAGWESERVLCPAPTKPECGEADVCAVPDASGKVCYINAADVACPDGWDAPYAAYAGYDGAVSCSACACGPPASVSCPAPDFGYWTVGGIVCYGEQPLGASCVNVSGLDGVSSAGMPQPAGGSCASSGGAVLGQPAPIGYTTICCRTPG